MAGHILTVSNFYPPRAIGGAEIVAHRQALLLRDRGWTVSALAGVLPSETFRPGTVHAERVDGVDVTLLALQSLDPDDNFRWALADNVLRATIARVRPDWLHAHNITGLGVDLIAVAKDAGVKVAVTLHDHWGHCLRSTRLRNDRSVCTDTDECYLCQLDIKSGGTRIPIRLRKDYVAHRLQQADLLISPSRDLVQRYAEDGFDAGSIKVQSNGIDLTHLPSRVRIASEQTRFLCAAYLGEHKGIPLVLDAAAYLHSDPELKGRWSLAIAGHGDLQKLVVDRIAAESWANVRFLGRLHRNDLLTQVFESDAVVLASIWPENEPVVLLEATASGAALLASRLGGSVDMVREGEGGLLFESGDARALAAAMKRMIIEPTLLEGFSQANLARRQIIDEETTGDRLDQWFRQPPGDQAAAPPLLICAGSQSRQSTILLSLLAKLVPGVRLIWHEWALPADWEEARGFWHWSEPTIADFEPALRRDLPIVARDGPLTQMLDVLGGPVVHRYSDMRMFWPMMASLCREPRQRSGNAPSLARFLVQLHETSHFAGATPR